MQTLVMLLTDENPEIRLFVVNQGLATLFNQRIKLSMGFHLDDFNDFVSLEMVFRALTD